MKNDEKEFAKCGFLDILKILDYLLDFLKKLNDLY